MSIFTKVSFLFLISIFLMLYLSLQTNKITDEKIEIIYKEKYIQASKELFKYIVNDDLKGLYHSAKILNYDKKNIVIKDNKIKIIYEKNISFGSIKIFKKDNIYFLSMKYLDTKVIFYDNSQNDELEKKDQINYLIIAEILLLVGMFLIILKILNPLKNISNALLKFGEGNYSLRLKQSKSNDEIAKVTKKFNTMAQNIENLITSRVQLLNDISHELRTPISKSIIALEMMQDGKYEVILKKSITQIDKLTNELLEIERLNSNNTVLDMKEYSIDTLLAESFSKMFIDDENEIEVEIRNLFTCKVDINYFSIAVKNLIDNALKYKTKGKVKIIIEKNLLEIKNIGEPLSRELDYYLNAFTQEDNSRNIKGYGLGLNLVKRILDRHNFELKYRYEEDNNIFTIKM